MEVGFAVFGSKLCSKSPQNSPFLGTFIQNSEDTFCNDVPIGREVLQ